MIADGLSRNAVSLEEITQCDAMEWPHLSNDQLFKLQQADVTCKAIVCALKFGSLPKDPKLLSIVQRAMPYCFISAGILQYRFSPRTNLIVAPVALHELILQLCHDNPLSGHFGTRKTIDRVVSKYWWPRIVPDTELYCKKCHTCAKVNPPAHNRPTPLLPLPSTTFPFERVHIDLLQMPLTEKGNKYLLVMVDAFSRWSELVPLPNKEACTVAQAIAQHWICRHGAPLCFLSDLGSEFTAAIFKDLCKTCKINKRFSSAAHAASNGRV